MSTTTLPNVAAQRTAGAVVSPPPRNLAIDTYRGFVMLLMIKEALALPSLAQKLQPSAIWQWIGHHSDHVTWFGCSLHDLIQPSFSFLVGVALPFSIASRRAKGQKFWWM